MTGTIPNGSAEEKATGQVVAVAVAVAVDWPTVLISSAIDRRQTAGLLTDEMTAATPVETMWIPTFLLQVLVIEADHREVTGDGRAVQ